MASLRLWWFFFLLAGLVLCGELILAGQTGRLKVELSPPEACQAGAAWSLDGGQTWLKSGWLAELPAGAYAIKFKPLQGWRQPDDYHLVLEVLTLKTVQASYVRLPTGARLKVEISPPEARQAGAAWSVDGGQSWHSSEETIELPAGDYDLTFKPLAGWTAPLGVLASLADGQTARINAKYAPVPGFKTAGRLKVEISPPEALQLGAAWSVDAGSHWYSSGQQVLLEPGSYRIRFREVPGFKTPRGVEIMVFAGQETTASGVYTRPQSGWH